MRIALKVGATYYPLAGQAGVSERDHSSAAGFQLSARAVVDTVLRVRASHGLPIDRGNLLHTVRFTSTRKFATPAAAFLAALDDSASIPRSGTLIMDAVAADGGIYRRQMVNAVVSPPQCEVIGATVLYDYSVDGGAISNAGYIAANRTGKMIVAGAVGGYGNGTYLNDGTTEGRVFYWTGSHAIFWVPTGGGYWAFSPAGGGAIAMKSTSDVEFPDLATGWVRTDTGASVSGFSITAETV